MIPVSNPLRTSVTDLVQLAYARMIATYPDWDPAAGDPMSRMFEAHGVLASEVLQQAATFPDDISAAAGGLAFKTPRFSATAATGQSTWTMNDLVGHTIEAGTQVAGVADDGTLVAFEVTADVVVPPGSAVTADGEVGLVALAAGAGGSGLTGVLTLLDRLSFIADGGIVLTAPTTGGLDQEPLSTYVGRLNQLASLAGPRPLLPENFAAFVRLMVPGVGRAVALNLYNADTDTSDQERCCTVVAVDVLGNDLSPDVLTQARALLATDREQSFLSFVISPTRTDIAVAFTGTAVGVDPALVHDAAIAAVQTFGSPALYGIPDTGSGVTQWSDEPVVYYDDVVTVLNNVVGFRPPMTLTLNGGTSDITLAGPGGGLPNITAVTGTVTAA